MYFVVAKDEIARNAVGFLALGQQVGIVLPDLDGDDLVALSGHAPYEKENEQQNDRESLPHFSVSRLHPLSHAMSFYTTCCKSLVASRTGFDSSQARGAA